MIKYSRGFIILVAILGCTQPVFAAPNAGDNAPETIAQVSPPEVPIELFQGELYTVKKPIALQFTLGAFTGHFEGTTLDEVSKAANGGIIQHQGDAGTSMYWLCYTSPDKRAPQKLWIMSDGEMGGREHGVTEVITVPMPLNTEPTTVCPALPANMQAVSIDQAIKLGMKRANLIKMLGKPTKVQGDWLVFNHLGDVGNNFTELGIIVVRLLNDKVVFLSSAIPSFLVTKESKQQYKLSEKNRSGRLCCFL